MVAHGETTKVSVLQTLADLANQKLPGYYFRFLPEIWEVNSEAEMLKLGCANRGDTVGGIAIRRDINQAFQLKGSSDHRLLSSWGATSVPITVIPASQASPPLPLTEDWLFVTRGIRYDTGFPFVGTMYHRFKTTYGYYGPYGQWKRELDRIRTTLGQQVNPSPFRNVGTFALDDGEYYGPFEAAPIPQSAFTLNRFVLPGAIQTWPQQLVGSLFPNPDNTTPYFVIPFDSLSFISLRNPTVTLEASGVLHEYVQDGDDLNVQPVGIENGAGYRHSVAEFRIRVKTPVAGTLSTDRPGDDHWFALQARQERIGLNPQNLPYQPGNLSIITGSQYVTMRKITSIFGGGIYKTDQWSMKINADIPVGGLDITIKLRVEPPYYFWGLSLFNIRGPAPFFSGTFSTPASATKIIHNATTDFGLPDDNLETTTASEISIPTPRIRVASKLNGSKHQLYGASALNVPNVDWWYDGAITSVNGGDSAIDPNSGQTKGVFMAKLAMIEGIGIRAGNARGPVLARYANDPIQSADGKVKVGVGPAGPDGAPRNGANYICVPRCFVRRDTDSPNKVRLATVGAEFLTHPRFWTVHHIYVRRLARLGIVPGAAVQNQNPTPLNVQIGATKNGNFVNFQTVHLLGFDAVIYPDWINWTSFSLAYQCSEAVDVQALLVSNGAINKLNATLNGGIRLADYFNNTFGFLSALPTP